jgi:NAD(P)-dependent dehydrogenase (short-subunit alcohol dehydrogenase family)
MKLMDRIAVVTGAGSGIGRATALMFAREGARVAVVDLEEATAKATAPTNRRVPILSPLLPPADRPNSLTLRTDKAGGCPVIVWRR